MEFEQYLSKMFAEDVNMIEEAKDEQKQPKDALCISAALLMRLFELIHEEIKDNDEVLHHMLEKITELAKDGRVVVMADYDEIKTVVDQELEDSEQDSEQEEEDEEEKSSDEDQEDEQDYE